MTTEDMFSHLSNGTRNTKYTKKGNYDELECDELEKELLYYDEYLEKDISLIAINTQNSNNQLKQNNQLNTEIEDVCCISHEDEIDNLRNVMKNTNKSNIDVCISNPLELVSGSMTEYQYDPDKIYGHTYKD